MPERYTIKNINRERRLFNHRIIAAGSIIVLLSLALIARLFYLQVNQHPLYTTLSRENQIAIVPLAPNRGLIYDRNGVLLAKNIPMYTLDIVPDRIKDVNKTINELKTVLAISDKDITAFKKRLRQHRPFEPVPLKFKLNEQEVAQFYINRYRFPGVTVNARLMRYYPFGKDMVSFLGYVGRINEQELKSLDSVNYTATNYIGKTGIEQYYEHQLHGTVGYQQVEVDSSGRQVRTLKRTPPVPGNDLYLNIDTRVQLAAKAALGDEDGAVVAIHPATGAVLALVSKPGFDPNLFVNGISNKDYQKLLKDPSRPLFNRALRGQFAPGSTIKPYYALEALSTDVITPEYTIYDAGWFRLPNSRFVFRDWKLSGHGMVDVRKAIIVSCDTFFYGLAVKMGIKRIDKVLTEFGFGQPSGLDLDGELDGLVPTPTWKRRKIGEPWYPGDTVNAGIGQGYLLTTPLQLADTVSALANRGLRFQPRLLAWQEEPDGGLINNLPVSLKPVVIHDKQAWDVVISAMEGVITSVNPSGTGYGFGRHPPYTVAGKTGTAQLYDTRRASYKDPSDAPKELRSNSLFIAFAPVERPQIAVSVIVEHVPGAAPAVARKVIDAYFAAERSDAEKLLKQQTSHSPHEPQ